MAVDEANKVIYAGFYNIINKANLIALKTTGELLFSKERLGGYEVLSGIVAENAFVTIGKNQQNKETIVSYNKMTGEVIDEKLVDDLISNASVEGCVIDSEIIYKDKSLYFIVSDRSEEDDSISTAS